MSIQGALTSPSEPQSQPQRRQNSSCDSCRRSKRRCFFLSQTPGDTNASCAHCTRLGNLCTFDFASSRLSSRPKKRQRQNISTPGQTSILSAQLPLEDLSEIPTNPSGDASVFTSTDVQDDFAAWLNFDIDNYLTTDQHSSTAAEPTGPDQTSDEQDDRRLSLIPTGSRTVCRFPYDKECVPGSSFRSPVHLLNSKLDTRILDERLLSIYETILTGSATRFLDYDTNPYATRIRYRIEKNCQEGIYRPAGTISLPKSAVRSPASGHVETSSPSSSSTTSGQIQTGRKRSFSRDEAHEEGYNMTVVGCARFLDHFGDIYGNRLSQSAKRKSDAALKAALRVFALQWLPIATSEPGVDHQTPSDNTSIAIFHDKTSSRSSPSDFYTDAWYQARMAINETKSVRSFRAVFAVFIFDGTAIPMSARSDSRINNIEHEFLNMGLEKLHQLDGLVQNYCTTLGPLSQYSALSEASLAVVRWSGYIRDTGAALTSDHQCRLPDPLRGAHTSTGIGTIPSALFYGNVRDFDLEIPPLCRKMAAEGFHLWRRIADIKNDLRKPCNNPNGLDFELLDSIDSAINQIESLNGIIRPFIERCGEVFSSLSIQSRVSCVSLAVPWELGLLVLSEALGPHVNAMNYEFTQDLSQLLRNFQQQAAFSVAQITKCVLDSPIEEGFNLRNGLAMEAPITAYHVTPSIMTTAIEKAVLYLVQAQIFKANEMNKSNTDSNFIKEDLPHRQIDCLMKGLLSLEVTIGGSQEVGRVLKSLLQDYGDIISECWSCDYET